MARMSHLSVGESGEVVEVLGDDALSIRLMEMGLTPGTVVQLLGQAPWGDPLEFQVRGYRLSLRRREAERIAIRRNGNA